MVVPHPRRADPLPNAPVAAIPVKTAGAVCYQHQPGRPVVGPAYDHGKIIFQELLLSDLRPGLRGIRAIKFHIRKLSRALAGHGLLAERLRG